VPAEEAPAAGEAGLRPFTPALSEADLRVRVTGRIEPTRGGVSLTEARVVVSGGRGVGSAEGFGILEELAGLLDAAVGCSRVATSLGWRPHADQVGQTGTRVAPELYIACGVSGAIQHLVGCKGAKRILAINTDPEAPMMSRADYAVIGDLRTVIPALIAEIRKARGA
jgi:electron transfer flavoprotein alpha subunit